MKLLLPPGWPRPRGYANGISTRGRLIFTAGIVGWDEQECFVARDFVGQLRQVLKNTLAVLAEDGAGPEHVVRMTWYVVDRYEYVGRIQEVGAVYREIIGSHYPCMAAVQVAALMEPEARVEIETIAVVPEP
ncbi:MAG TPA: RidA family protein [Allosphingosinicella sp.]|jgi:enamine deaminase RidA (YjgF/YER057c/UK114 family)